MVASRATLDEVHRRMTRRIRELSKARKITLSHLPDRAGVARSHFWSVLAGERSPTLEWLRRIAKALDHDVADLLVKPGKQA